MTKQRIILVALGLIAAAILSIASPVTQTAQAEDQPTSTTVVTTTTTAPAKAGPTAAQIKAWVEAVQRHKVRMWAEAYQRHLVRVWVARYNWNKWMAAAVRYEASQPKPGPGGLIMGRKTCGGDLPPCYVMLRESKGYINIWNGGCTWQCGISSASGKWQFVRGTWAGYGGYRNAADAPESVQDAKARQLWAGGRGCGHWAAC